MNKMFNAGKLFNRYLIVTNTCIGAVFAGAGDLIQQTLEKKFVEEKPYDANRARNMTAGGLCFGILAHGWYNILDRKFPGREFSTIAKKLLAEMAVGPPLVLGMFLGIGYLDGKTAKQSFKEFKKNILTVCLVDWLFYCPLQALNFYYLPHRYRVLYVCTITIVYDVFLSYIIHKEDNDRTVKDFTSKGTKSS